MTRLPAIAGAVALLLCCPPQAGAQTYHRAQAEKQAVHNIVYHRSMTWRFQDRMKRDRSETVHRERRSELPTLRRLAHYWEHLHYISWRTWQRTKVRTSVRVSAPAVDSCLSQLISRESNWNVTATNPSTGAYGLPQALPGSKMASAGADWATNPATQIRWMIGYVNGRYGGTCAALSFQMANGYY